MARLGHHRDEGKKDALLKVIMVVFKDVDLEIFCRYLVAFVE